jgi:EAL domain-containing protein (putative c-di-GMP-specific phosphodiesterase class I)
VIRRPGQVQGREIVVTASVGVTVFPDDADDAESLLRNAIGAAYRAKDEGRDNLSAYAAVTAARAAEHLSLEQGLRSALSQRELVLLYQPVVDLQTGGVDAVEALIRWQHPQLGLLGADVVIAVAESSGLIHTIGEWALRTACLEVAAVRRAGHPTLGLCVNLSAHQFDQPGVVERIGSALAEAELPPEFLELEITETVAMRDVEATASCLRRLKDMGTRIAIDDFGTGYSGLSYLKRFSLDTLKIDKSFIRDVAVDRDDGALVTAIISMAHARRLRTVAEGIENQEQLRFLLSRGCDRAQGFLLAPPMILMEAMRLLDGTPLHWVVGQRLPEDDRAPGPQMEES